MYSRGLASGQSPRCWPQDGASGKVVRGSREACQPPRAHVAPRIGTPLELKDDDDRHRRPALSARARGGAPCSVPRRHGGVHRPGAGGPDRAPAPGTGRRAADLRGRGGLGELPAGLGRRAAQIDVSGGLAIACSRWLWSFRNRRHLYYAYVSGHHTDYTQYAAANMTGSNRLLMGLGWPVVVLVGILAARKSRAGKPAGLAPARQPRRTRLPSDRGRGRVRQPASGRFTWGWGCAAGLVASPL